MKIIDMHCDTISCIYKDSSISLKENALSIDISKLKKGNYLAQCFAMFVPFSNQNLFKTCNEMITIFKEQIKQNENDIEQAFTYQDILKIQDKGKIAAILTIEEGAVIENNLENLQYFYDLGVRMITLTWNYYNEIGYPNFLFNKDTPDFYHPNQKDGLTPFGIKMVEKMNELGIIIDVSHLSDKGTYDVLKYSKQPFVASHSNARNIHFHCRNLSDDLILKMAQKGCVIGVNYCADFLVDKNTHFEHKSYVKDIVKHIKHIVSIGGIDCVGLGSDFDGIPYNLEMKDCSMLSLLVNELQKEGFNEEEIKKICYENVLNLFKKVLK